jgi:histidine triad (HIT) family protein
MNNCLFCKIVDKKIPAKLVQEDEHTVAFDDINPQAPVHTLVIPKRHVSAIQDLNVGDESLLAQLLISCTNVAALKGLQESCYRLVANTGRDAGQTVFHLHFHVLGGRHLSWPPG